MNIDNKNYLSRQIKFLALLCLLGSGPLFAFGIGISPTTVEMVVEPGSQHRQTITVQNVHKAKTLALTVGVADWTLSETGELELLAPGSFEYSAAEWVQFSPAFFSLGPGETRQVQVDLSVPVKIDKTGERRMAILISTLLPSNDKRPDKSGVWNRYQVASLFYVALPGAEEKPTVITSVALQDKASLVPVVKFTAENPGNYHARLKGYLGLKNQEGKQVFKMPVDGVLTAKQTRSFKLPIKFDDNAFPAGEYKVDLQLVNSFSLDGKVRNQATLIKAEMPTITIVNPVVSLK
ncbi:MAG: hypothetical protein V3V22_07295 [Methylococcales bacterium]